MIAPNPNFQLSKGSGPNPSGHRTTNPHTIRESDRGTQEISGRDILSEFSRAQEPSDILDKDLNSVLDSGFTITLNKFFSKIKNLFGNITGSSQGIARGSADFSSGLFKRHVLGQPKLITGALAFGAVLAGLNAIRDFVLSVKIWNKKEVNQSPAILVALKGLLNSGLSIGLIAPFMGSNSPFMKHTADGKAIVPLRNIIGAVLAPFLLSVGLSLGNGTSRLGKLPLIGDPLKEIFKTIFDGIKYFSSSDAPTEQQRGGQPAIAGMGAEP